MAYSSMWSHVVASDWAKNEWIVPGFQETHNKGISRLTSEGRDGYNQRMQQRLPGNCPNSPQSTTAHDRHTHGGGTTVVCGFRLRGNDTAKPILLRSLSLPKDAMTDHEPAPLPDLFCFQNGTPMQHQEDWPRQRLLDAIVPLEYGGLPPTPASTKVEELHKSTVTRLGGARYITCRVVTETKNPFAFLLYLLVPPGSGPFPVVLNGDGCWHGGPSDEIAAEVLRRGYALAVFDRTVLARGGSQPERTSGTIRAMRGDLWRAGGLGVGIPTLRGFPERAGRDRRDAHRHHGALARGQARAPGRGHRRADRPHRAE